MTVDRWRCLDAQLLLLPDTLVVGAPHVMHMPVNALAPSQLENQCRNRHYRDKSAYGRVRNILFRQSTSTLPEPIINT